MLKHAFAPAVNGGGPCAYIYPEGSGELTSFVCNASLLAGVHDLSSDLHAYQQGPEVGRCSICGETWRHHSTLQPTSNDIVVTTPLPPCLVCSNCRNSLYDGLELHEVWRSDEYGDHTLAVVWIPNTQEGRDGLRSLYMRKYSKVGVRQLHAKILGMVDFKEYQAARTKETAIAEGIKTSEKALEAQRKLIKERWGV